jgi:large subunit ribosomal protein L6
MSHIGKEIINIPKNVKISLLDNRIIAEGKYGILYVNIPVNININININHNKIIITPIDINKSINSIWGLTKSLITNIIKGVNQGFIKKLQLVGIGYKAKIENNKLILNLGFSHPIEYIIPDGISINLIKPTLINIIGNNYNQVTQVASTLRTFKRPEPYNGKGIKYLNEKIVLKEKKKKS